MDTLSAFVRGAANRGRPMMIFDWNKAAKIIKARKPKTASAGLSGDWEWTGGEIYEANRGPVPRNETYTYLASTWATPELKIDDDMIDCFIMEDKVPKEWSGTSDVYWPQSALDILQSEETEYDLEREL